MNYFGQVALGHWKITSLEKNYFGNSEIEIFSLFLEIFSTRKLTLQKHVLNFKMHISREPLMLEQQMSWFDKKSFIK